MSWQTERPNGLREEQLEGPQSYLSRERRLVFLRGPIADMQRRWDVFSSISIQDAMMAFNHQSMEEPITLVINSPGGEISEGFVFYDAIKQSIAPVVTVVQQAASMATVIAAAGDLRLMYPHSRSMLHLPQSGMMGDSAELQAQMEELEKVRDLLVQTYVDNGAKKSRDQILDTMRSERQIWMSAQETIDYGLADRIITPDELYGGNYGSVTKRS